MKTKSGYRYKVRHCFANNIMNPLTKSKYKNDKVINQKKIDVCLNCPYDDCREDCKLLRNVK